MANNLIGSARRLLTARRCSLLALGALLFAVPAMAADPAGITVLNATPTASGGQEYSLSLQTLILLTSLTFLPAALLMMTGFTRIIIVLSLLRQALGTQSAPPNQVMIGLALFFAAFLHFKARAPVARNALLTASAVLFLAAMSYIFVLDFPRGLLQERVEMPWPLR